MSTSDNVKWHLLDVDLLTVLGEMPMQEGHLYLALNEPGSGSLKIPLDSNVARYDVTTGVSILQSSQYVQCTYRGAVRGGFFVEEIDRTHADSSEGAGQSVTISGRGPMTLLNDAIVWDDGSGKTKRTFTDMTMADVLIVLIAEAQARGALLNLDYDFTAILDTHGHNWVDLDTLDLTVGKSMLDVVRDFAKAGLDFSIAPDGLGSFVLSAYLPFEETDLGSTIYFRTGSNVTKAVEKEIASDVKNALRVQYKDGFLTVKDCVSQSNHRRKEGKADADNAGSARSAHIFGLAELEAKKDPKYSRSLEIIDDVKPYCFLDYNLGNDITSDLFGKLDRYRIRGLQLDWTGNGYADIAVDLNSDIIENEVRMAQEINALKNRATTAHDASLLDKTFWAAIGEAFTGTVVSEIKIILNDVYVGGTFTKIGGVAAVNIAHYDILTGVWIPLAEGLAHPCTHIEVIGTDVYAVHTASNLYYISKWNGASWSTITWDTGDEIYCSAVYGINLLVAGGFLSGTYPTQGFSIRQFDGASWSDFGLWFNGKIFALCVVGADVWAGGEFTGANGAFDGSGNFPGGVLMNHIATNGDGGATGWAALGVTGVDDTLSADYSIAVYAIAVDDLGVVYAGGNFLTLQNSGDNDPANYIAKFVPGDKWYALEGGTDDICGATTGNGLGGRISGPTDARAAVIYSIVCNATEIFIVGDFLTAGGLSTPYATVWNGSNFEKLGTGFDAIVKSVAAYNLDVYFGGSFTTANDETANKIVAYLTTFDSIIQHASGQYVHPNHYGDVVSDGDRGTTIQPNVVTLQMMADIATASMLGRISAATGDPEDLTPLQARAVVLPDYVGNSGKVLAVKATEDDAEWVDVGGTPGGVNGNIQFNDAGALEGDTEFIWDKINKILTLGSGGAPIAGGNRINFFGEGATPPRWTMYSYNDTPTSGVPGLTGVRGGGTKAAPTQTKAGMRLNQFVGLGYDNANVLCPTQIADYLVAAEDFTTTSRATKREFYTTPVGSTTPVLALTINADGTISSGGGDPYLYIVTASAPLTGDGTSGNPLAIAAATAAVNGYATSTQITKLDGIAAGAQVNNVGGDIHAASAASLADADEIGFWQLAGSVLKKSTWANVIVAIKAAILAWASASPGAAEAVLKSTSAGKLTLVDLAASGDIYTTAWTNWSASASPAGWAAGVTTIVWYKKIGKMVFVQFNIDGTSNAGTGSFTLPATCSNNGMAAECNISGFNNDNQMAAPGHAYLLPNQATLNFQADWAGTAFAAANRKQCAGLIIYEST